jgi:predicted DNA-binding transcriptional regulator YafY
MRLTGAELQALELGLAVLAGERPPEEQSVITEARARLASVIARLPADDGVPGDGSGAAGTLAAELAPLDAEGRAHLAVLRDARRDKRPVRLTYRRSGTTASTDRTVCPYAVVVGSGAWYVIGWCVDSAGVRVFRLDRIERAEAAGTEAPSYTVPDDFDADALVRNGRVFSGGEPVAGEPPATLVVRYGPTVARWIVEREGGTPAPDGSLVVERPLADVEWALRHVLQYGPDAEVLAPEAVRVAVAARLDAMLG